MTEALAPHSALYVALGAVPGAWLRFRIVNHLEPILPRKHWATYLVNVSACFALGLMAPLLSRCSGVHRLELLLVSGFLGSYSTFSSFVVEVLQAWLRGQRAQSLVLSVASLLCGVLAVLFGLRVSA